MVDNATSKTFVKTSLVNVYVMEDCCLTMMKNTAWPLVITFVHYFFDQIICRFEVLVGSYIAFCIIS